jgi:hypothetical protein
VASVGGCRERAEDLKPAASAALDDTGVGDRRSLPGPTVIVVDETSLFALAGAKEPGWRSTGGLP